MMDHQVALNTLRILEGELVDMSETKSNGGVRVDPNDMDANTMLEVLIEANRELTDKVDQLQETMAEILEKIDNISLPGGNFGIED